MADVSIKWKNQTLAEMSASGSKTLKTAGKYLDADVVVEYAKSGGTPYETNIFDLPDGRQNTYTFPITKNYQYLAVWADLDNGDVSTSGTDTKFAQTIMGNQDRANDYTAVLVVVNRVKNTIACSHITSTNTSGRDVIIRKLNSSGAFSAYYTPGTGLTVELGSNASTPTLVCFGQNDPTKVDSDGKHHPLIYRWVAWGEVSEA